MVLEGTNWPSLKLIRTAMPELERARAALNGYVHPNSGGHVAALFPERTAAARLLLDGMASVYKAFFSLSWAERSVTGDSTPLNTTFEEWPWILNRFVSHMLPDIRRKTKEPDLGELLRMPEVIDWLTTERTDLEDLLHHPDACPLLMDLLRRPRSNSEVTFDTFNMWDGARRADVLNFALARRAEQILA
jgi:hypothetical protein